MERKRHRGNRIRVFTKDGASRRNEEETKKKILRRTTTQSKSTSSFPLDLTSEILLRLPVKSVVRSRCVSKAWSAITTNPYFTNSFNTRNATRVSVLLFFKKKNKFFVFSIPQDHHQNSKASYTCSIPISRYEMKSPEYSTESVHGLICFQDSGNPILWNPTMRDFLTLPKPEETWKDISCLLGYDPIEGNHKVICMPPNVFSEECRVLTLGSDSAQQSWRIVKTNHKHLSRRGCCGRCISGVVYYLACRDHLNFDIVMSFDVRSEKFGVITLPMKIGSGMLIPYEGKLACVVTNYTNGGITLSILDDAEKQEWSDKHFPADMEFFYSLETHFHLDGITSAGEFVYVTWDKHLKTFYVLFFDPKRRSLRKIEFADEEFWLSNGVGNKKVVNGIFSCMDHMESLMSL